MVIDLWPREWWAIHSMVITAAGESLIVIMVMVPSDNQSALLLEGVLHVHSAMTDR